MLYSIKEVEGFVQITGKPGTGKTLILRTILRRLGDSVKTALIYNPMLAPEELLRVILEGFGMEPSHLENIPKETLLRSFRDFLLKRAQKGKKTIVIVDEGQNLPNDTLEELRLLSNLETDKQKLLQIILVGQLELEEKLQSPDLKQLAQRITIRYQLKNLSKKDTRDYVYHRLGVAAGKEGTVNVEFTSRALKNIYKLSNGIPRLINIICERALMAAFVDEKRTVGQTYIKKAMESIRGEEEIKPSPTLLRPVPIMVLDLVLIIAAAAGIISFFISQ